MQRVGCSRGIERLRSKWPPTCARSGRRNAPRPPSEDSEMSFVQLLRDFCALETIATRTPVMPIGDGLRRLRAHINPFQLSEGYAHFPPAIGFAQTFHRAHLVRRRTGPGLRLALRVSVAKPESGDAEGTKRKLQLFFEMAIPSAESLGLVVAVHDDFVSDSILARFINLRLGHGSYGTKGTKPGPYRRLCSRWPPTYARSGRRDARTEDAVATKNGENFKA